MKHASYTTIGLHDGIHNATVVINALQNLQSALSRAVLYIARPSVRPIVPICPPICHTGGSIKNGWWRLCNFHRTV